MGCFFTGRLARVGWPALVVSGCTLTFTVRSPAGEEPPPAAQSRLASIGNVNPAWEPFLKALSGFHEGGSRNEFLTT